MTDLYKLDRVADRAVIVDRERDLVVAFLFPQLNGGVQAEPVPVFELVSEELPAPVHASRPTVGATNDEALVLFAQWAARADRRGFGAFDRATVERILIGTRAK